MAAVIVTGYRLYRYRIPLVRPLSVKGTTYSEREGLVLELHDSEGSSGVGEIAPLSGFSHENLNQVQEQIETQLRSHSEDRWKSFKQLDNIDSCIAYVAQPGISKVMPSVEFGLGCALCRLMASQMRVALFYENTRGYVSINALLTGDDDTVLNRVVALRNQGYTSFKLKVGQQAIDHDIRLVHRLREAIGDHCALRLDANRAWGIDDAVSFLEQVTLCGIEYVEEPVNSLELLQELLNNESLAVPIALDETLAEFNTLSQLEGSLPEWSRAAALIMKPSVLGLSRSWQFARIAEERTIPVVYSSSFESPVGVSFLAQMAAATNLSDIAAGLGTLDWFPSECRLPGIESGRIDVTSLPGIEILDPRWLSEVGSGD